MRSAKLLAGIIVSVAVVGFSVAAFAVDGGSGPGDPVEDPTTTTDATTTTTVEPTTTTTLSTTPTDGVVTDDPTSPAGTGTERSTEGCGDGTYANHGAYVSSVAHDPDRQPGDVSAAAQSDCGKPVTATGAPDESTDDTEATEPSESGASDPPSTPASGNGVSNGHANGNAQGHGQH